MTGVNLEQLASLISGTSGSSRESMLDRAEEMLTDGRKRFLVAAKARNLEVPRIGFRETAVVIDGKAPEHGTTESFLQRLFVAQHTGWLAWVDSRRFSRKEDQPIVYKDRWERLVRRPNASAGV
jgi:hypothetical protein